MGPTKKRPSGLLGPRSTLSALAVHPLLNELSKAELVVYLRLLEATERFRSKRVRVSNHALYSNARTAADALRELKQRGLVATSFGEHDGARTIEVL